MEIFYENNRKQKINLSEWPIAIEDITPLFAKKWNCEYEELRKKNRSKLKQIYRTTASTKLKIQIFADSQYEYEDIMDIFQEITEIDVLNETPGKLWCNGCYRECFVIADETQDYEECFYTVDIDTEILSLEPFWIQELTKQFLPQTAVNATRGLNYPFDYPFNYAPSKVGLATWEIDHYTSSHFLMRIYGPCVDPKVFINNYPYQVFTTLEAGDYLEIDTRNNTVIKYLANGTTQNCYNSRQFTPSIFEKIPPGSLTFSWPGNFGFDMTVFIERSEPKWDTSEKYYIVDESGKYIITE